MADTETIDSVKAVLSKIDAIRDASKIILFGSRTRDDYTPESDVDLMIVFRHEVSLEDQKQISKQVRVALVKAGFDSDVLIRSQSEVDRYKNSIGHVVKAALEDGIVL